MRYFAVFPVLDWISIEYLQYLQVVPLCSSTVVRGPIISLSPLLPTERQAVINIQRQSSNPGSILTGPKVQELAQNGKIIRSKG